MHIDDPNYKQYRESLEFAGQCAGEYLEEVGKTDLADLTEKEWLTLLDVVVRNQRQKLAELPPF